jgi:hypothetical protein
METFVIRIWTPAADDAPDDLELRGLAEHVAGGERTAFRGSRELVAFLESALESSQKSSRERGRPDEAS